MKFKIAAITAAAMLAGAWTASAAITYNIEHSHSQGVGYANIDFNGSASGGVVNSYLGRFIMEPKPNTALPAVLPAQYPTYSISTVHGPETGFFSYCLEPLQSIGVGHGAAYQYPYTIDTLAGTDGISGAEAGLISELFGRYSPLLQNEPSSGGFYTGGTFRTAASALQLAIWKINLDAGTETLGSWDFGSGLMRMTTTAAPLEAGASQRADFVALAMLNSLTGSGPMAYGLEGLRNPQYQDVLIQAVPEPTTMIAGALLLLPFGASTIRFLRKNRTA